MNKDKLARALSILLGPQVWLPLLITSILLKSGLTSSQLSILFPGLVIFQIFVPLISVYIALRLKKVTGWDLPKREERYWFLILTLVSYLFSIALIYFFGNKFLLNLSLIFFVLIIVISIITYFWKISLHASINTVGPILLNFLFSWQLPWLYLSVPLVYWARLKLKRHTLWQLIAGSIISGGAFLWGLRYLN